jgi:hypothetical protein
MEAPGRRGIGRCCGYIEERKWERIYRYGRMKAQEQGLAEADVECLVCECRA